jgi:hypothetical protein
MAMARSRRSAAGHLGVEQQRLGQDVADLLARIQRPIGVLEDDLHLLAHFGGQLGWRVSTFLPSMRISPSVRSISVIMRASVDLPQPLSPTMAKRLARSKA